MALPTTAQLQRGQMALNPRECDVVQLIDNCVLTLQGVASVPIVCHIAASLPQMLTLDALRVGQVSPEPARTSHACTAPR